LQYAIYRREVAVIELPYCTRLVANRAQAMALSAPVPIGAHIQLAHSNSLQEAWPVSNAVQAYCTCNRNIAIITN